MENAIFLTEAEFSHADFDRVTNILAKIMTREIGQTLYRYGGPSGVQYFKKQKGGDGIGALFFVGSTDHAIRLNYEKVRSKSLRITSIDWWNSFEIGKKPDKMVLIPADINSVWAATIAANFAKEHAGKMVSLEESVYNDESMVYKEPSTPSETDKEI